MTVLYWFYGDCCSEYMNNHTGVKIRLATNSFTLLECEFLCELLEKEINCRFYLEKTVKQDSYLIALYKQDSVKKFYNYIGPCTLSCFNYKWKEII